MILMGPYVITNLLRPISPLMILS